MIQNHFSWTLHRDSASHAYTTCSQHEKPLSHAGGLSDARVLNMMNVELEKNMSETNIKTIRYVPKDYTLGIFCSELDTLDGGGIAMKNVSRIYT